MFRTPGGSRPLSRIENEVSCVHRMGMAFGEQDAGESCSFDVTQYTMHRTHSDTTTSGGEDKTHCLANRGAKQTKRPTLPPG